MDEYKYDKNWKASVVVFSYKVTLGRAMVLVDTEAI